MLAGAAAAYPRAPAGGRRSRSPSACSASSSAPPRRVTLGRTRRLDDSRPRRYFRLAAVVSEGAGTRWLAEPLDEMSGVQKWVGFPFLVVKTDAVAVFSNTMPPPELIDLAPRIAPTPVFLIWNGGPAEKMNPRYHAAAGAPKAIWKIPEAGHIGGIHARHEQYERRVVGFFDDALLAQRRAG
jgi:hypothetical protein